MKTEILTNGTFQKLIYSASLASSADNMQPWEFKKSDDSIEVHCAKSRLLPTDIFNMFTWISIGAAIQNIVISAEANNLVSFIDYNPSITIDNLIVRIRFLRSYCNNYLEKWLAKRMSNRNPYLPKPLTQEIISKLSENVMQFNSKIYWTTSFFDFAILSKLDANSSYIRLEHKPFHDELFDILRFSKKELEKVRYGLCFDDINVPRTASIVAKYLSNWTINKVVSNLGLSRLVAKNLSVKLRKTGAICLLTVQKSNPQSYIEAGRAMQQLWLAATAQGLSVQPYGVLPQYFTRLLFAPESFTPEHLGTIQKNKEIFYSVFPEAENEYPAIVLRIGISKKQKNKSMIRLNTDRIIKE